jgi:phage virion morphogenesis protein
VAKLIFRINDGGAKAKLAALTKATSNMQPVYATIGRVLVNRIRLCFKLGIDPWGSPWAALKLRKGQPLRDTGRLNRSIAAQADDSGVTVGTNVSYAPTHQFGATIVPKKAKRLVFPGPGGSLIFAKKVTVPARPFLPLRRSGATVALPPAWSADVVRALKSYLRGAVQKLEA